MDLHEANELVHVTKPGPDRSVTTDGVVLAMYRTYGPAVGTSEIAEQLGVSRQAVDNRLREMETNGLVLSRKIGRSRAWWLSDRGERRAVELATDSGRDTTR